MKRLYVFLTVLLLASFVLAACGGGATPEPIQPPAAPTEAPAPTAAPEPTKAPEPAATEAPAPVEAPAATGTALTCAQPIKIGLITDLTGGLAIYGIMANRSFQLGMEYASGAPGTEIGPNAYSYKFGGCEVQVRVRDDKGSAEETATKSPIV